MNTFKSYSFKKTSLIILELNHLLFLFSKRHIVCLSIYIICADTRLLNSCQ